MSVSGRKKAILFLITAARWVTTPPRKRLDIIGEMQVVGTNDFVYGERGAYFGYWEIVNLDGSQNYDERITLVNYDDPGSCRDFIPITPRARTVGPSLDGVCPQGVNVRALMRFSDERLQRMVRNAARIMKDHGV